MPIIEVNKLGKDFGAGRAHVRALAEVSFAVEEGSFVTLVGPSGCGKSTLLQILAGLIAATRGEARIDGERIRAPMPDKIGMVFQDPTLLPWKTALANARHDANVASPCSISWTCGSSLIITPTSSPAACASASPLRAGWRKIRV
jgi:ABC-type nitrate/sulfonate/bicarbonate transport system ATPase subunit